MQLREALGIAGQRPVPAPGGARPGRVGIHVHQHGHVAGQRLAHPGGQQRAPAQRQDAAAGRVEQLRHDALLALAERRLALAVEELRDRHTQLALDLPVRVHRRDAQHLRRRPGRGGLARPHEPDEDERRLRAPRRHRRQSIRSS